MSSTVLFLIVAAVLIIAALVVAGVIYHQQQSRRRHYLRERFGPEYDRLVAATGSSRTAERELEARAQRAAAFHIRTLSAEERAGFTTRWQQVQAEFVDNPKASLSHADDLLGEVMGARGYPVQDFEQRAADLSVDHPVVVQHYHAAHGIALRHRKGETTTEDLRQAMIHYRALFQELVSDAAPATPLHVPHAAE
ncbi:MAG TPA: hypothetical protein VFA87_06690 [Rhizomicrobium sp.]|nr:hypothetical protein [Rhizomicrobium sp.]